MAKEITLTKGQVTVVDDEDFEELSKYNWQAWWMNNTQSYYAARCVPHPEKARRPNGHLIQHAQLIHRVILGLDGVGRKSPVDHKDGDGLNNQRSNLRVATPAQNNANKTLTKANTSGFKGVHKVRSRWRATIRGRHIGYYATAEEGHAAYMKEAIKLYGEFANAG